MRRLPITAVFLVLLCVSRAEPTTESLVRFVQEQKSADVIAAVMTAESRTKEKRADIWIRPLLGLKPLRAYRDRVNLVVVVSEDRSYERGIYVVVRESSHLPVSDEEWLVTHVKDGIYIYERTKKA